MTDDPEALRSWAAHDHAHNRQAPMKSEQDIQDATSRNTYNAALHQRRQASEGNK